MWHPTREVLLLSATSVALLVTQLYSASIARILYAMAEEWQAPSVGLQVVHQPMSEGGWSLEKNCNLGCLICHIEEGTNEKEVEEDTLFHIKSSKGPPPINAAVTDG